MNYLITGATGNVGSQVVARLIALGHRPRVFVRNEEKAREMYADRVEIFIGDLADAQTLEPALTGAESLLLITSGHDLAEQDAAAARLAVALGVKHLVKLSSYDAREQNVGTGVWHAKGEAAIRATGIPFTFVQPSGFMSNALYWATSIKAAGVVRTATGDGKIPFIHPRDIAEVVVQALVSPAYRGASLPITGPEALSYAQMASVIGAALGKPVQFQAISEEEARRQQSAWGAPPALVEARLSIFRAIREGRLATVTDTLEQGLKRRPASFERWVGENVESFR
jgi:(4-alkanoyl-5-oxo-2,5-dihydrofuran-3-yl)methyl phosphate reductase